LTLLLGLAPQSHGDVQINPEYVRDENDKSDFEKPVCDKKYGDNEFWTKKNLNFFTCAGSEYMGGDVYCKERGAAGESPVIATPVCLRTNRNMSNPTNCARAEIPLRCREKYDEKFGDIGTTDRAHRHSKTSIDEEDDSELAEDSDTTGDDMACTTCAHKMSKIFNDAVLDRRSILCNSEGDRAEKVTRAFKKAGKSLREKLTDAQCSGVERGFVQSILNLAWREQKDGDSDRCNKLLKQAGEVLKKHRDGNEEGSSDDSSTDSSDSDGFDAIQ
jgi:hypothetical protein